MDEEILLAAQEEGLDLNCYEHGDTITIEKGELMRIFEEIYRVGFRDGVNTGY